MSIKLKISNFYFDFQLLYETIFNSIFVNEIFTYIFGTAWLHSHTQNVNHDSHSIKAPGYITEQSDWCPISVMNDNKIYWLMSVTLLLQWSISLATSDTFHIVISPAAPCPGEFIGEPCLTLQQYVSNPSISHGNITLLFETGTHSVSHAFSASNAHSYSLSGYNVSIECISNTVSYTLTSIQYLNITGLKLSNCGSFTVSSYYTYFTELQFSNCGSFQISSEYTSFADLQFSNCGSFTVSSNYTSFADLQFSNCGSFTVSSNYTSFAELQFSNCGSFTVSSNYTYFTELQFSICGSFRISSNYTSFTELQFSNCNSFVISSHFLNFTNTNFSRCGSFRFNSISYMFFTRVNYTNSGSLSASGSTAIEWSNVIFTANGNAQFANWEYLHITNCSFNSNRICPLLRLSNVRNGSITYSSFRNNQYSSCWGGALHLTNSELTVC